MQIDEFIARVHDEGVLLLDAAASAGLAADVPSCDEWVVRDLVRHVGGVHHWAARQLGEKRSDEITGELVDIVGGWPPDDELIAWASTQHEQLVHELERADPAFPYFTWVRNDHPLTMWARRQAHETAVHRVDADLAAGRRSTFDPAFAADGIDELVLDMVGYWERTLPVEEGTTLHVVAGDIERAWTIDMSPAGFTTASGLRGEAHAVLGGTAEAIYQALWGRGDTGVEVTGDASAFATWSTNVKPEWA